jgi:hypothetical protein
MARPETLNLARAQHGPRLTFPTGRRFAPHQGHARPLCGETVQHVLESKR